MPAHFSIKIITHRYTHTSHQQVAAQPLPVHGLAVPREEVRALHHGRVAWGEREEDFIAANFILRGTVFAITLLLLTLPLQEQYLLELYYC